MKTRSRSFSALALTLMLATNGTAQLAPEARAGLWRAQWITLSKAPERDAAVLQFRKVLEIKQVPQRFVVHVSADNQFVLNVNQREVGRGPARGDLAHWKYETYDLARFLRPGRNEIAAMVWSLGVSTAAQMSDRTAFVLQGDTAAESAVDTNNSWEVAENTSIQALPISQTARAQGLPEFWMPRNRGDNSLVQVGKVFLKNAQPVKQLFIDGHLPADFLEKLHVAVHNLELAIKEQTASKTVRTSATRAIEEARMEAVSALQRLDPIMENLLQNDAPTFAAWQTCRRVERAGISKSVDEEPPPAVAQLPNTAAATG